MMRNKNLRSNLWENGREIYRIGGIVQLRLGTYRYSGNVSSDVGYKVEYYESTEDFFDKIFLKIYSRICGGKTLGNRT